MDKEVLLEFVERDVSIRSICRETGKSLGSVRHWLNKYGLSTLLARIDRPQIALCRPQEGVHDDHHE